MWNIVAKTLRSEFSWPRLILLGLLIPILAIAFSYRSWRRPDITGIATCGDLVAATTRNVGDKTAGQLNVWSLETGRLLLRQASTTALTAVACGPGERQITLGKANGELQILDVDTAETIATYQHLTVRPVTQLSYVPGSKYLVIAVRESLRCLLVDAKTGQLLDVQNGHGIIAADSGKRLTLTDYRDLRVFDIAQGRFDIIATLRRGHAPSSISPDAKRHPSFLSSSESTKLA